MIEIQNVSKSFGVKRAVDNVSFQVEKGQIMGLLGPNGAGKSTLLRIITGCLASDSGQVRIQDKDIDKQPMEAKQTFGYLPESAAAYSHMNPREFLTYLLRLRDTPSRNIRKLVSAAIETCFLESVQDQLIGTLSKGYTHRVCLAQSLVHDPPVFIFDEPTDGLDPNQKSVIRNLIRRVSTEKAILFSTHILEEVETVCTDVVLMHEGRLITQGTPQQLKTKSQRSRQVELSLKNGKASPSLKDEFIRLGSVEACELLETKANLSRYQLMLKSETDSFEQFYRELNSLTQQHELEVADFQRHGGSLEEVFRNLTTSNEGKHPSTES